MDRFFVARKENRMIAVMHPNATPQEIDHVVEVLRTHKLKAQISTGEERTVIGVIGTGFPDDLLETLEVLPGVDRVTRITRPYKLASRDFKPRTSPYAFQGLGGDGLDLLAQARARTGLPVITEVMEVAQVERVAESADILQIGARNMQNFPLLKEVGKANKPAMLKRGLSATIEEWLMAAEYIMKEGNNQVILCERGIRTFETATRNPLDLSAIPLVKRLSHLPIIADPSHGTGHRYLVQPMALAAAAAGADGLIVEVHPEPDSALSDGPQSLTLDGFEQLMRTLEQVLSAVGRPLAKPRMRLQAT